MSETTTNPLALQIVEAKLPAADAATIETTFLPFFTQAREWKSKAEALVVNSPDEKEKMKEARKARLILKDIRVNVEKRRKELKEDSLRKGKTIDAVANIIKGIIEPIEDHLDRQEKFVELQEQQRKQELRERRSAELIALNVDITIYANLGEMPEEGYQKLLESSRNTFNLTKEAAVKAEAERVAKEKADAEERERIRLENERLKKEAEAKEAEARKEREAKEKAERELREKREEEARLAREHQEAEAKAKRAPDKEKLLVLAEAISDVKMPEVDSPEARAIIARTVQSLASAATYLKTQSLAL